MTLQVFQSLWAMSPHDQSGETLPYDAICGMVKDAGFHGLAIDLGAADVQTAHDVLPHIRHHGLVPLIVAFPRSVPALRDTLKMAKDFGSPFVNLIGQVFPLSTAGAIPVVRAWIEMSEEEGVPVQFETHRNCITNDLFTTLELIDAVPEMRLSGDLSHYLVDREWKLPLGAFERGLLTRILQRCDSFQGRVASRQQIQLQLDFPQNAKWLELFTAIWREGFGHYKAAQPDTPLTFLCELGPPEYAMTDATGREMSNRWQEALRLKALAEGLWAEA